MRRVMVLTILISLLAACGRSSTTPEITEQPLPPPTDSGSGAGGGEDSDTGALAAPPAAYLISGETLIPGEQGSYCWTPNDGSPGLCVDTFWPAQLPPGATFEAGDELVVRFEDTPPASISVQFFDAATIEAGPGGDPVEQRDVTLVDGDAIWTPEVAPGMYLVTLFARWPESGDSTYFFGVEIIAAGSQGETNPGDGIDAVDLSPPDILLLVGGEAHKGSQGGYCWSPVKGDNGEAPPGICADVAVLDVDEYFALSAGEGIHLRFDEPHPTTVNIEISQTLAGDVLESLTLLLPGDTVEWNPQLQPGQYILTLSAEWEAQGDSLTLFGIRWP